MQNNASPPSRIDNISRETPGQNLGIPLSVDPTDASSHVARLFSDSNELVIQPIGGGSRKVEQIWEMGSTQVHRAFEITSEADYSIKHGREWRISAPSRSSVSIDDLI